MKKGLGALGQGELARGLGLLEQGELIRGSGQGLGAWALFRIVSPRVGSEGGKKGKNQKLKGTKTQYSQQLLFHFMLVLFYFMLVLFCYLT